MAEQSVMKSGFRLIRNLVALHPLPFTVAVIGAVLYAAGSVGSTVVLGRVTDQVLFPTFETGEIPSDALGWALAAILAVTFLRVTGVLARRFFAGMTSERCQRSIQAALGRKYLNQPLSWHHRTPTGELLAHADNDAAVSTEVLHPLPFSLGVAFLALFSSISLLLIDVWLAVVAFLIFPALSAFNRVYSRWIEEPAALVQAGVGTVSSIAHESFDGALVVKTLGRAEAEGHRFADAANELRRRRVTVGYIRAVFEAVLDALPNFGIVLVVIFGVFRIDDGAISRGDLVQVASLFTILALPMRVLGFFLEMMPPSVVARRRLDGVLDLADPTPVPDPADLPEGPLSIAVHDLQFDYHDGTTVLDGVDFEIAPGEVVALVGSTGAGKSTLCHLVAGLIPPTSGSVQLGGQPLERFSEHVRTSAVALVFQESFLFADTLRANIDLVGDRSAEDLDRAAEVAQAVDVVDELPGRYETVVGERGVTLSGGQRQRVALARAVIRSPRLLILDDATSAVDPKVEQRILSGLRDGAPTTSLIVAQRVSTIRLADRVLYLADGRIAAQGSHDELMNHPGYSALVRAYESVSQ